MNGSPALGELLDLLCVECFAIGVDDHVRVGRLLALETAWSEVQLRSAIRSVIVKDAQERAAFDAVWTRLFVASVAKPLDSTPPVGAQGALSPAMPERPSRRLLARRLLAGLLTGIGAVVVTMVIWWQWPAGGPAPVVQVQVPVPVPIDAPVPVPIDAPVPVPVPIDAPAPMPIDAPMAMAVPVPVPVPVPTPKLVEVRDRMGLAVLLGGGVLLAAAIAIGGRRARRRRRFIPGPWQYSLQVPAAPHPVLDRDDVLDGAAHLTSQADREATGSLDVDRSMHVTVATGGAPVLVYRPPPAAPRYLVLEDRAAGSERWRFLYDELLRGLAREGVDVTRYTFVGDPSLRLPGVLRLALQCVPRQRFGPRHRNAGQRVRLRCARADDPLLRRRWRSGPGPHARRDPGEARRQ